MRVSRDHAGGNHTGNLFEKKGMNSKGNHSSAEENGKLPLSLTGKHSTQARWTNPLNWIYIPVEAVRKKKTLYNSILLIFIEHQQHDSTEMKSH